MALSSASAAIPSSTGQPAIITGGPAKPGSGTPGAPTAAGVGAATNTPAAVSDGGAFTLAAEVSQALRTNPAMAQALEKLRASQARLEENLALHFPQYGLTTTATGNKASGYAAFPTLSTVLSIPLDTAGRNSDLIRQARADLSGARWTFRRAQADMALQVSTAYYGVLRADEGSNIAEEEYNQAQAQLNAAQNRFNAGDAPRSDILKAQVQLSQAQSNWLLAQSAARQARAGLNNMVGANLSTPITLAVVRIPAQAPPVEQLRQQIDSLSPEIQAASDAVTSTQAALSLVQADSKPQLSFQGNYTYTRDPTTYPHIVGAGVSIQIPLPDGGVRRSREAEARAIVEQAKAALESARRQAALDLEMARLSLEDARQRAEITSQGVRLAVDSLRGANIGYANGVSSARDVIDAAVALRQARIQNVQSVYDYNLAAAKIYSILGTVPSGLTLPSVPI